jgi:hypothetical protein
MLSNLFQVLTIYVFCDKTSQRREKRKEKKLWKNPHVAQLNYKSAKTGYIEQWVFSDIKYCVN